MFKNGLAWPIWTFKTQVMAKRRARSWESIWLLACKWRATYSWKTLKEGYNFALDLISIEGLLPKLWGLKITKVPTLAISRLPLGSPKIKSHLDVGSMGSHRIYYKGEGGGFPRVQAVVSLVSPSLPMARLSTKSVQTTH
jgi:hypothetical protein